MASGHWRVLAKKWEVAVRFSYERLRCYNTVTTHVVMALLTGTCV